MASKSKTTTTKEVQIAAIQRLERATVQICVLGTSPLVMNRMPAKAKQQLLLPRRTLNKAAREQVLKHDPVAEYRDSIYRCREERAPTLIHIPNGAFKKAMAQAAIDTPGATKAETGRLVKVLDETVFLYGKPFLYMDVVRMAGFSKAPDIRTRAMFPKWACRLTVQYIRTRIREQDIANLMGNAGDITGIGDGRTEKGTFDYGSWELVDADDKQWLEIVKTQGRKVQLAAMEKAGSDRRGQRGTVGLVSGRDRPPRAKTWSKAKTQAAAADDDQFFVAGNADGKDQAEETAQY